ncbi:MAG TPA: hypothetical protein QF401_00390 [Candidatus Poseidoniaceae archaeon]|nr:hypothetical protein [Candidatus Poseidoniaceae archaeon]
MELNSQMAKPSKEQTILLNELRDFVIDVMLDMPEWVDANVERLRTITLGVLRRNATQRHGVTRWKRGVNPASLELEDVEVIDLHPKLLNLKWRAYSAFVLHHEYIHALGLRAHNSIFRQLESAWPGHKASTHGIQFTEYLRREKAIWLWCCPKCQQEFPRQKPSRRRFRCRKCNTTLIDKKNPTLV